jgi:hypothetical protein
MSNPDVEPERETRAALGIDLIIPLLACALAIYYFISTADLVLEAKATGNFVGIVLIALCAAQFARFGMRIAKGSATLGFGDLFDNTEFNRQRLALIVMVALFIATIYWVGTTLGLFLLLIGTMWVMGVRSARTLLTVAFTTAATVHVLLITLLDSRLPLGVIMTLLTASGGS